ncbi:hypothetical protein [Thalassotalea aquiviva]|uniref:hypothetical protein n=1 Tax=Thalassotalea aquiviva TaxID=3242415 RepID=UPI00352B559B
MINKKIIITLSALTLFGCSNQNTENKESLQASKNPSETQLPKNSDYEAQLRIEKKKQRLEAQKKQLINELMNADPIALNDFKLDEYFKMETQREFETKNEFHNRLLNHGEVDKSKTFFFEIDAGLRPYDMESQSHQLLSNQPQFSNKNYVLKTFSFLTEIKKINQSFDLIDPPYSFSKSRDSDISPELLIYDYSNRRNNFMWITVNNSIEESEFIGTSALGVDSKVTDFRIKEWGLVVDVDSFNELEPIGEKLIVDRSGPSYRDALRLYLPLEKAKQLNLSTEKLVVRLGFKYTYGTKNLSVGKSYFSHTPTLSIPLKVKRQTRVLVVELYSFCLLNKENKKIISCRVNV